MKEGGWGKGRRKREKEGQRIGRLSGIRHSERQQGEKQSKIGGGDEGGGEDLTEKDLSLLAVLITPHLSKHATRHDSLP